MNTIIEEIRKRIEARKKNTYHVGDYDEYADGIVVGLSYALGIIDEVEKEHPVPAEEGKILPKLREFLATATPEELEAKYRELEYLLAPKDDDEDANKAAEKYGKEHTILPDDYNDGDIPVYEEWTAGAFKDGILYERERMMKEAHDGTIERDCGGQVMLDVPDIWERGEYTLLNPRKYSDMKPKERRKVKVLIVENE